MSGSEENRITAPKPGHGDTAYTLARAVISGIPVLGGPATELLNIVITPPLERRRIEWMNIVAERLSKLEKKVSGFRIENLKDDQFFISIVTQATIMAIRTHQEEKLEALRNAVVNSAFKIDIDANLQLMFLHFIDSFTPLHLKILKHLDDPSERVRDMQIGLCGLSEGAVSVLHAAFPDVNKQPYIINTIVRELFDRGLVFRNIGVLRWQESKSEILSSCTTKFGKLLIRYISADQP